MAAWKPLWAPWGSKGGTLDTHVGHFYAMMAPSKHLWCQRGRLGGVAGGQCWSRLVKVGRGKNREANVGPAEGGEASPPSFAEVL